MTPEELDRFVAAIRVEGPCWIWTKSTSDGYGDFKIGGKRTKAHIAAYEYAVSPVPKGRELDHLCRHRACCNPEHLEPVTHKENVLRGEGIAAVNARKTHCKRGHPFTSENTGINSTIGTRFCKICAVQTKREWYLRRKKAGC